MKLNTSFVPVNAGIFANKPSESIEDTDMVRLNAPKFAESFRDITVPENAKIVEDTIAGTAEWGLAETASSLFPVVVVRWADGARRSTVELYTVSYTSARSQCSRLIKGDNSALVAYVMPPLSSGVWEPKTLESPAACAQVALYVKKGEAPIMAKFKLPRQSAGIYTPVKAIK